jgi:hypothetical protein
VFCFVFHFGVARNPARRNSCFFVSSSCQYPVVITDFQSTLHQHVRLSCFSFFCGRRTTLAKAFLSHTNSFAECSSFQVTLWDCEVVSSKGGGANYRTTPPKVRRSCSMKDLGDFGFWFLTPFLGACKRKPPKLLSPIVTKTSLISTYYPISFFKCSLSDKSNLSLMQPHHLPKIPHSVEGCIFKSTYRLTASSNIICPNSNPYSRGLQNRYASANR